MAKDLFVDMHSKDQCLLEGYIHIHHDKEGRAYVTSLRQFDDDEFSDNDLVVLDSIVKQFGHLSAEEVLVLTRQSNSPWSLAAKQYHILIDLLKGTLTTDYKIDFRTTLDVDQQMAYDQYLEYLDATRSLK